MEIALVREEVKKIFFEQFDKFTVGLQPTQLNQISLNSFEEKYNLKITESVIEWLNFSNGSFAGQGGIFGLNNEPDFLNLETYYDLYPEWIKLRWLPIAGDGCGNYYIININHASIFKDYIFFIDTSNSIETFTYVVASNIWYFLYFIIKSEKKEIEWPFNKKEVLNIDPYLSVSAYSFLPWNSRLH